MKTGGLIAILLAFGLMSQAQTSIKVISSGCFNSSVQEITIDAGDQLVLSSYALDKEDEKASSFLDLTVAELNSNVLKMKELASNKVSLFGFCTFEKAVFITEGDTTTSFTINGCSTNEINTILTQLFEKNQQEGKTS